MSADNEIRELLGDSLDHLRKEHKRLKAECESLEDRVSRLTRETEFLAEVQMSREEAISILKEQVERMVKERDALWLEAEKSGAPNPARPTPKSVDKAQSADAKPPASPSGSPPTNWQRMKRAMELIDRGVDPVETLELYETTLVALGATTNGYVLLHIPQALKKGKWKKIEEKILDQLIARIASELT